MVEFDVVVCGLGGTGSAALLQLARRGVRVLGLERFTPGHDRGSSHGATRVFRVSYFEHPSYVPLVRRALALWRELETTSHRALLHGTGIIEIGQPGGTLIEGTLASARLHGLHHELLTAPELKRRFPAFEVPADYVAVFQPDGGYVEVEASIEAHNAMARAAGAEICDRERVEALEPAGGGVKVVTDRRTIDAGTAILAAGPWTKSLRPELPLHTTRQVTGWFEPVQSDLFEEGRFPVFMLQSSHGIHYGVPPCGSGGLKVAKHHHDNEIIDPEAYDRAVSPADERLIRAAIADHLPAANGRLLEAKTCLYTMTPDGDFLIDRLPDCPQILVASACSGHGFKFGPVIGEILADLATAGTTRHDITRFRVDRFQRR